MDDDAFLDALLGLPPPPPPPAPPRRTLSSYRVIEDLRSTLPGTWTCRQSYGGYVRPPLREEAILILEDVPVEIDPLRPGKAYDQSLARMKLRASDKRDTKIKKQKRIGSG